mmetsp:Transcript_4789/g.8234  ORF Transcript_4789/g.8234 Transcript_4789/m.8234 type:complete len:510 (-) Transcript_4789:91-1620(-)
MAADTEDDDMLEASNESAAALALRGKRTRISGAVEEDGNPSAINRRNRGSVFGALVGASSTKKARGAHWRDEIDEEDKAASGLNGQGAASRMVSRLPDEESEDELIDPGTPLPSDEEEEAAQPVASTNPPVDEAAEQTGVADPTLGAGDEKVAKEGHVEEAKLSDATNPAPAADESGPKVPVNGHVPPPALASDAAQPAAGKEDSTLADAEGKRAGVVVSLEMVSGPEDDEEVSAPMEVLCWGTRAEVEERLASCLIPGRGAAVQALFGGRICTFSNHPSVSSTALTGPAEQSPENGSTCVHSSAGLLAAPLTGPGLLLTFGRQPALDATHRPVGLVLRGRYNLRRLDVLAPCCGDGEPSQPLHFRVVGVKRKLEGSEGAGDAATVGAPIRPSAVPAGNPEGVQLEPVTVSTQIEPFAWEDTNEVPPADELELIDLGLDMREAEVAWLKGQTFSRERQQGVDAVQDALAAAKGNLDRVTVAESDQALSQRRHWLQERTRYLLRLVGKLQ